MNIKNELIKRKNKITSNKEDYNPTKIDLLNEEDFYVKPVSLNDKIEEFIEWDKKNMEYIPCPFGTYDGLRIAHADHNHDLIRNLINKIAIWYELRYPDYEIKRIFDSGINNSENSLISEKMFIDNPYIKEKFDVPNRIKQSEISKLKWEDFYNKEVFISSLTEEEQKLLFPIYSFVIYTNEIKNTLRFKSLSLTSDGIIIRDESELSEESLAGKHINDIPNIIKDLPKNNAIEQEIRRYKKRVFIKEQILTCAMYKIIENNITYGSRRALLFAKEFNTNIDIPVMYGLDSWPNDEGIINFANEYLNLGGNPNLICYNHFYKNIGKAFIKKLSDVLENSQGKIARYARKK